MLLIKPVYYLTLFKCTMSDGCKNRIPVFKAIFIKTFFNIFRLGNIRKNNTFSLTVVSNHFLALNDIIFL